MSVRTFCKVGDSFGRVKELLNVKVEGSYKPLMADLDQARSRKSYSECATGIIAFNVTNNTGYGNLKFYISKAPAGVALGEVFPTSGVLTSGYIPYTLPDLYPTGQYQIDIDDNCGKSTITFTIEKVAGLPPTDSFGSEYIFLSRPYEFGAGCNQVRWKPSSKTPNSATKPDLYRYYIDQMYEVALLPAGVTPTATDWKTWTNETLDIELPGQYKDYHVVGSLSAHLRLKGCDQLTSVFSTYLSNPRMNFSTADLVARYCDYYVHSVSSWQDYDNFWCYPVNLKITNTTDGVVEYDMTLLGPDTYISDFRGKYKKQYDRVLTGADGVTYSSNINVGYPYIQKHNIVYKCNTFTSQYYIYNIGNWLCYPVVVDIYKLKEGGNITIPADFEYFDQHTFTETNTAAKAIEWEYGYYRLDATFENFKPEGVPYKFSTNYNVAPDRPTAYTLSTISPSSCIEDVQYLYIRSLAPSTNTYFPTGTTFTVVEAPVGYPFLNKPHKQNSSSTGVSFNQGYTPAGSYKVRVDDGCGQPIYVEATLKGGYSARKTKFVVARDGCDGERLKIEGFVTLGEDEKSGNTFYQILSGPKGFDDTPKFHSSSILLAADGDYTVGVKTTLAGTCFLRTETIKFVKSKPTLNPSITSSYVCTDRTVGYIIVKGQNGTEPYTYDLLNENKTPTGAVAIETNDGTNRVYFDYGNAGEIFYVRITDDCGNQNDQEVKLIDLKTQRIVYNTPPSGEYCTGGTIELNCITLGETTYLWRGPNGYTSTDQNPRIFPATEAMTGYYSVSVMPEFCGESVTDQLYIKVFPELVAGAVSPNQEVCITASAATMSSGAIGGKGLHLYQWQISTDGTNWTNVLGADRATYTPPKSTRTETLYYRLQITDDCQTVFSAAITLNFKACYIMVNPNIRTKAR